MTERRTTEKRAIQRRILREVLAREGLKRLPRRRAVLLTGSQGSGKTREALEAVAVARGEVIVWATQPNTAKAEEVAADYRQIAGPDSLPVMVVRGRSAADPRHPEGEPMCLRAAVTEAAAKKGIPIRRAICASCPLGAGCGYMRQDREIQAMEKRGFFVLSRAYLFLPCPAPAPDLLIADEAVTIAAIDAGVSFPAADIERITLYRGGGGGLLGNAITAGRTLTTLHAALRTRHPFAALRAAGVTEENLYFARHVIEAVAPDLSRIVDGAMSNAEIKDILDRLQDDPAPRVLDLLAAVTREIGLERDTITGVTYQPERGSDSALVTIFRLREMRSIAPSTSILALDGTGSPSLNAALFPGIKHVPIPMERTAYITGTIGKSYSRQSLSGKDRSGRPLPEREDAAMRLRQEISLIAARMPGPRLIVSNKPIVKSLVASIQSKDTVHSHFGGVRGLNGWEHCQSAAVVGRESLSIEAAEGLARAYMARDPRPFVPMAGAVSLDWPWPHWPFRATRGRQMRDGSVQVVEVEVHPDPRVQEIIEQIREAEIVQAVDRVRPIFNQRTITLMNNLALDVTYDRVLSHADLVAGGSRWERAWGATGIIPLGAAYLHRAHPCLFRSVEAARHALKREPLKWGQNPNNINIWNLAPFDFRGKGQPGKASRVLVDTVRHADPRAAVEAALGSLVWLGPPDRACDPGQAETAGDMTASTASSRIWADPPPGFARYYPPGDNPNTPPEPELIAALAMEGPSVSFRGTSSPCANLIAHILTISRIQKTLLIMRHGLSA